MAAFSADCAAGVLAGHPRSAAAGWTAVAGGCSSAGAVRQPGRLCPAEAEVLGPLQMALVRAVAQAYLKAVSIPNDVRKGLILDQLENMGVSKPVAAWQKQRKNGFS